MLWPRRAGLTGGVREGLPSGHLVISSGPPLCRGLHPGATSHWAFDPCALQVSKSACVLTTQAIMRLLRSKEAAATVDVRTWPTILDTGTCHRAVGVHAGPHRAEPLPFRCGWGCIVAPRGAAVNGEEAAQGACFLVPSSCFHPLGLVSQDGGRHEVQFTSLMAGSLPPVGSEDPCLRLVCLWPTAVCHACTRVGSRGDRDRPAVCVHARTHAHTPFPRSCHG